MKKTSTFKNNLRRRNVLSALWNWIRKPRGKITIEIPVIRWGKTKEEKEVILKRFLTRAFSDYDLTTGEVNIFPTTRAAAEIKKMHQQGTFDYYYELFVLNQKHNRATRKLARKYNIGRIAA